MSKEIICSLFQMLLLSSMLHISIIEGLPLPFMRNTKKALLFSRGGILGTYLIALDLQKPPSLRIRPAIVHLRGQTCLVAYFFTMPVAPFI